MKENRQKKSDLKENENDIEFKILKIVTVETGRHLGNAGDEIIIINLVVRHSSISTVNLCFTYKTFVCR